MTKKGIIIFTSILLMLSIHGCKKKKMNDLVKENNIILHLDFDDNDKYVKDASNNIKNQLLIENIYNEATFKESTPALRRDGVKGTSLSFDGWSNFIDTFSSNNFDTDGSISLNVWIAPRVWELPTDTFCPIVEYYDTAKDSGFIFGYKKYGYFGVRMKLKDSSWVELVEENDKLALYEWTNIGFSYSRESNTLSLFKDGVILNEISLSSVRDKSNSSLKIGINTYYQTGIGLFKHNMFSGLMDELIIYNTSLSSSDVTTLFTRCLDNGKVKESSYEDVQYPSDYLDSDVYRPSYHAKANTNWSSDASGGFYYNGMYHMFYQSDDTGPIWRTFTWGHLVSEDGAKWRNVEPAIYAEDNMVDSYSTFAGSAIVCNNIPYLVYTGIAFNSSETAKISLATPVDTSDPELRKWKKLDVLVTLPSSIKIRGEFRDPFVYMENDYLYMIATASLSNTGRVEDGNPSMLVFRASVNDITKWEYKGVFFTLDYKAQHNIGFMWELPQLYKLTSPNGLVKYMFSCTPVKSGDVNNDMLYWIGDFDKENCRFIPDTTTVSLLDKGSNVLCAGSGFYDPSTGKNMSTSVVQCVGQRSEHDRVFSGWVGVYQLFRNYSLNDDGTLKISFEDSYEDYHNKELINVANVSASSIDFLKLTGRELHIKMGIKKSSVVDKAGIMLLSNKYKSQGVSLYYEKENNRFALNTLFSKSEVQLVNYEELDDSDIVNVDIYVDKSVIEFIVNGRLAFTARAFTNESSDLVQLVGDCEFAYLQIYKMK